MKNVKKVIAIFDKDVQPKKREKLSHMVMNKIMNEILENEKGNLEYLPTETELTRIYDVSRITVREAVRGLEERGFVERQQGKGVKVINKSIEVVTDSLHHMILRSKSNQLELLEVRKVIEVQTARFAAMRADESDLKALNKAIEGMKNSLGTKEEYMHHDLNFHILVAEASKNTILESIMKALGPLLSEGIMTTLHKGHRPDVSMNFHQNIYEKILAKDIDGAETCMKEHLEETEKLIIAAQNLKE